MHILITGSAGFIGHHAATRFVKEGYRVTGLDNLNAYYEVSLKLDRLKEQGFNGPFETGKVVAHPDRAAQFVKMDLADGAALRNLFETQKFDYVINLAAQAGVRYSLTNPQVYIDSNITGFLNLLEAIRAFPVRHLVFASSSSVYGLNRNVPFAVHHYTSHPISLYAASKKSNEMMAHTYAHLFGIPSTGLRFFTVYGPWGRPDMAMFLFTNAILKGEPLNVFNHGDMQRDFTYVDDIVESIYRLVPLIPAADDTYNHELPVPERSSAPYRLFNIGNNNPENLMDLVAAIEEATGKKAVLNKLPMQAGDLQATYADVDSLAELTGFKPSTSLREGVSRFVKWYMSYEAARQAQTGKGTEQVVKG